jgi:hypothetical protein
VKLISKRFNVKHIPDKGRFFKAVAKGDFAAAFLIFLLLANICYKYIIPGYTKL